MSESTGGCKANEAADKIVEQMAETGAKEMGKVELILKILDRYGLATLGLCGIAWFAWVSIEYEREKMMPCIESNTKAMERNSEVIRQLPVALKKELNITEHKEEPK